MDSIPEQFTHSIGRIVFNAGRVEFLIGRMLPSGPAGQSGKPLITAAREIEHPAVREVLDGYERMLPDRNHLIHGTYQVTEDQIVAWHLHRGGDALTSHPYSVATLAYIAESWENLAHAAHRALHQLQDPAAQT
ncbi:hypothetical protein ACFVSU_01955 [Microbacterium sp. NPDC058062]|uniref:hypothetical protein n=1 Tax=Microbacterium sp. NPDC058062 TaxID=3346320 RepID=UPI0036DCCA9F